MAKKKKKQETESEKFDRINSGKYTYYEGGIVGDAKTGTRTSVSEVNALRKAAQQKAAEEYQNELNNRTTLQWLNARDKSEEELKVAQNRLLTSMQDKGINAKIEGTKAVATPYKMEDLEVGVPKTFNKNNLNKELDNRIAFLDYTKSGEYRTLQRDVANKWDERAFNQSNLERKMAEEDMANAGPLKKVGLGILAGFADAGSALRGDLNTSSGVRYASYGETLESELPDKAKTPVGQFALQALPQFTKLWGDSAFGTAGQVMYFLDGVNDAYNSAKTRGYSEDASRLYGTLVGSLDTIWNVFLGSRSTKMGNETPGVFEKMYGKLFEKIFKSNAAKEMATTLFSEGSEEFSQEYVEKFLDHTILDVYDKGENFDVKAFLNSDTFKDSLESFLIGAAIGGGMKSYQNIMTPKDVKNVNQAIYTIERSNGRELSNYNKALINNITAEYENKLQKVPTAQTIINTYNNLKSLEVDNFRNNAVNLYTNLDDNSRVQYNNLIDDVSELIYNTGIPIRFDSKLDTISEWDNNTLVVNPALTDTPMKTLLLKELGTKLVDNSTKKYILSYMKKNGLYDTLKSELLASGEFDEANVDNEIVSRELNSIFEDQNKLEQLAKNNEGAFNRIKSVIYNLASTVGNRQTKDAVFLKVLGDRFNVIDLSKNNVNISELKVDKNKKSTVVNNVLNVDTNQYKGIGKKSVENIVNSNLLDNSITAKELVHFIGKISEDTGREIKLVDNKDLKDLGLKVKDAKGKILSIEGFTKDGVIRVNMNAQNPLNVVIGHELTDSLRGSKYYDGLVKAVNNFISEKEKNTRLENLNKLYANVENAKINDELVSDVVGEYLFTNKDFLEKLTEDRGLFNRLFDEVRYLWRQFRGKNTALDKLMHDFTKVYNDKVAVKSDFNYSLQEKKSGKAYGLDNEGTKLTQDQLNYFEDAATYDVNGALIRWYHTTTSAMKPFTIFNPVGTPGYKFGNQVVIFTTDDKTMSGSYANSDLDYRVYRSRKLENMEDANSFLDGIAKIYKTKFKIEDNTKYENGKIEVINKGTEGHNIAEKMFNEYFVNGSDTETDGFELFNNLLESSTVWNDKGNAEVIDLDNLKHNVDFLKNIADTNYKKERASVVEKMYNNVHDYLSKITDVYEMADEFSVIYDTLLGMYSTPFNYEYQYDSEEEMFKKLVKDIGYAGKSNIQYELYANVKNPLVVDLKGRSWTRDWNKELYNKYKDREWFKKNKTDKRALEFLDRFTGDNADDVKLQHKLHKLVEKSFNLYSDNYNKSKNSEFLNKYTISHTNLTFNDMAILDTASNVYKNYKEFYNDYGENYGFPKPSETINTTNARNIFDKNETTAEEYFDKYMEAESAYQNYGKRDTYFINEIRKSLALEDDDLIYQALNDATDYQLSQLWSFDMTYDYDIDDAFSLWLTDNRREYGYQTNDIIRDVLESNAKGETNYDGVIIKNVVDYGHLLPEQDHTPHNLCIAFSPEQVKSIYNQHPTSDPDIDYKLSQIASEEKGDYNVYGKDIKANPLVQSKAKETVKDTYKSYEKLPNKVKKGTYIEPKTPIKEDTKKGKKFVAKLTGENKVGKELSKNYTSFVDKLNPIQELAEASGNKYLYPKFNNRGMSAAMGQYQIGSAQTDINGNEIGKSINDIWKPIENAKLTEIADEYLLHRLNVERYSKVPVWDETITPEMSKKVIKEYESKYPVLKSFAEEIYKFNDNELQKMIDAGITKENAREWLYSNYATISRDIGPKTNPLLQNSTSIKVNSPLRRAKGGNYDIRPMKETMARQAILTAKSTADNIAGLELLNVLGGTVGEKGSYLSQDLEGNNNTLVQNPDGTYNYTVYKDGTPITMKISKEIADAIRPTKIGEWENLLPVKAIRNISGFVRSFMTDKNALFILTNFYKDIGDAPLNSKHNAGEYYANYPVAVKKMIEKSSEWKQYVAKGGKSNTYFETSSGEFKKSKNKFINLIQTLNQFVEQAPRFNEYLLTLQHGGTIDEALYNAAEVTTNFARGGEITKMLNRNGFNFLNASVQGFDKQIRNFSKQPGAKQYVQLLSKVVMLGIAPAMINHLLLEDDDEYEELKDYVKDNYYIFKDANGHFIRIPKGRVMAIFGTAARHTYEASKGNEDIVEGLKDTATQFINNVAPNNPLENNIFSPLISVSTNKSWNGSKIVSTSLEKRPVAEQYDEKTSSISKWLGKTFNQSPKKIDYLLDQYSGGIGDFVLPMTTPAAESGITNPLLAPFVSKFTVDSTLSNKYVDKFYDIKDKMEKEMNIVENIEESEDTFVKALQYKYLQNVGSEMSELYKEKKAIQNSNLNDKDKYQKSRDIQRKIDDLAKFALEDYTDGYYTDDYAVVGDKEYHTTMSNGKLVWSKVDEKTKKKQEEYAQKYDMSPEEYYSMGDLTKSAIVGSNIYKYNEINSKLTTIRDNTSKDKEETVKYINSLNLSVPQKAMYIKSYYPSFDDYNEEIINYVNSLNMIPEQKKAILIKLGFDYNKKNGTYSWK